MRIRKDNSVRERPVRAGRSRRALLGAVLALGALAACGEADRERELADPNEPGSRIRAMLEGASAPVLAVQTDTVHFGEQGRSFYAQRGYRPAWTDRKGFLPRGEVLLRALRGARADGIDPRRYHAHAVEVLLTRAQREHAQGLPVGDVLGNVDMVLTEAFVRYANDLVGGTLDPDSSGVSWLIPRSDATDAALLERLLERDDLEQALDELRPSVPFYHHLRRALPRYETVVAAGGWLPVSAGERLEQGVRSPRVLEVRRRLVAEGDPVESALVADAPDPDLFDASLARAVEHFQERHGIDADGAVGAETVEAMNVAAEDRLLAVLLNLDRWRWLPRQLGQRYLLVNVAGFEMAVMEASEPVLRMNVVVGKEGWNTPVFQDTLEHIVVNPFWNVPPSIIKRDLIPAMQRDPGYLARNGFEIVRGGGGDSYQGLAIRQRPGRNNSLGEVKFLFPNAMNVYLHDTPAKHLFKKSRRAFSSGCIRVEKPRELAEYLLRTATSQPPGTYERLRATGREQWVALNEKIPVYILYFTAWADPQGSVAFYSDVYRRDRALDEMARGLLRPSPGGAGTLTALADEEETGGP